MEMHLSSYSYQWARPSPHGQLVNFSQNIEKNLEKEQQNKEK